MEFDSRINPRQPYLDKINALKYFHEQQEEGGLKKHLTLPFRELLWDFSFEKKDTPERERIEAFLNHVDSLSTGTPTPAELETAPCLDEWSAIRDDETVLLIGIVTGHPHIRDRGRARTSLLFQVHPEKGWARTWSRYYRLGVRSRMTFFERQYEGKIRPRLQIVEFDN